MQFAYEGFTHAEDSRCFHFRSNGARVIAEEFCIKIKLLLFSQNHIPVQDGPRFCLELLETASTSEPNRLDQFHAYSVGVEDFRPLLLEREKKAAERAMKNSARKPFRKPSMSSNLSLGKS